MNKNTGILFLAILLLFLSCRSQMREYNFDFEDAPVDLIGFPQQWERKFHSQEFSISTDYFTVYKGKASVCISYDLSTPLDKGEGIMQKIPIDPSGKELELRAFLKLDRVFKSGLILQTEDENGNPLNWDTLMYNRGYSLTKDWREYSVKIPISANAKYIVIGAYLFAGGTLWADNFQLYMDKKPYFFNRETVENKLNLML